jgi:hypothetical protein
MIIISNRMKNKILPEKYQQSNQSRKVQDLYHHHIGQYKVIAIQ